MLRRSPSELYLKYMLLHPKKFTHEQIHDACKFAQLDSIGDSYLARLKLNLVPPEPFHPLDESHRPSSSFLLREGLYTIFHPDQHGKKAFNLLKLPRAKEFIEAMTMSGAPLSAIAYRLSTKGMDCTEKDLVRYTQFFWDISLVDSTELRALLQLRIARIETDEDTDIQKQYPAFRSAYWGDSRRVASEMPESPVSALVAQMRMGLMPNEVDSKKLLQVMFNMATVRAIETVALPGQYAAKNFSDYVNSLRTIKELQDSIESPDERLQKDLRALTLKTTKEPIPNIHQLSGGNHTLDILPKNKEEEHDDTTFEAVDDTGEILTDEE